MTSSDAVPGRHRLRTPDAFAGRASELALLQEELRRASEGEPRLVLVDGPGGIGKTALIRRFLGTVTGGCVLRASGAEGESTLPYGVLAQWVEQVPRPLPDSLGPLARTPGCLPTSPEPVAAGFGLLDLLGEVGGVQGQKQGQGQGSGQRSESGPVVLVLDDAHWADQPSMNALAFALRRLRCERVLTIVALPDPDVPQLPGGTRRLLADVRTLRVSLDGLSPDEVSLLSAELGSQRLSPAASVRLRAHTRGSPLHVRALLEQVPAPVLMDVTTSLPAPHSYALLVLAGLAGCGAPARRLVQAVSVLGTSCLLSSAARLGRVPQPLPALQRAVRAGLLHESAVSTAPEVAFPHPLVHAAVYQDLGPAHRAALHARAADLVGDEYARLRHRVLAATGPDEHLTAALAACARREAAAGQWAVAGTHLRHASRLSTTAEERDRLAVEAVEALLLDGRVREAADLADGFPDSSDPALRGYARGYVARVQGHTSRAQALLADAWEQCERDPSLAARTAEQLSHTLITAGRAADAARWAERARRSSTARGPGGMLRYCRLTALGLTGAFEEGMACSAALPDPALVPPADVDLLLGRGQLHLWSGELVEAQRDLAGAVANSRTVPVPLQLLSAAGLAQTLHLLGDWDRALTHAEASASIADDTGQAWLGPVPHTLAAQILAARGDWDRAQGHVRFASAAPGCAESTPESVYAAVARGHVADARAEPQCVVDALRPLLRLAGHDVVNEPGVVVWQELLADALVQLGAYAEAAEVLAAFEERARARGRHAALSGAARVRGNLHAARREPRLAEAAFLSAHDHAARVPIPFGLARVRLDHGSFLRRTGRRTVAVDRLQAAYDTMYGLRALPYWARCVRELNACGRTVPEHPAQQPSAAGDGVTGALTPQELAVARLASQGLTNRRIASELALSVKTVEYHLGHTYTKLGIASRIGLVGKLAPPVSAPNHLPPPPHPSFLPGR
ncbi:AAA family ATPase [Streptomyces sp. NBC_00237]|uniref:ATP-binding protein n=1 Tax=Streptomyces sp. NBC_00237 TaxID=2975687 RepID=UPI0022563250|nr:AAA family ATPase [Streptomyces sp. NBC_00237]MCX5205385.1 AAA family ATPase [Streptomyces sp. NBC_00237]